MVMEKLELCDIGVELLYHDLSHEEISAVLDCIKMEKERQESARETQSSFAPNTTDRDSSLAADRTFASQHELIPCSKSQSQERRLALSIFWDYERVQIPSHYPTLMACNRVVKFAKHYGYIRQRNAYADLSQVDNQTVSDIGESGFAVVNSPRVREKETLDNTLIVDILLAAWDTKGENRDPCILLITSNGDFAYTLNTLRDRGVSNVVIHGQSMDQRLKDSADEAFDLEKVLKDQIGDENSKSTFAYNGSDQEENKRKKKKRKSNSSGVCGSTSNGAHKHVLYGFEASQRLNPRNPLPPPRRKVAIFWDYENVNIPARYEPYEALRRVETLASHYGSVQEQRIYADYSQNNAGLSTKVTSAIANSGFHLMSAPRAGASKQTETLDRKLTVDAILFAWDAIRENQRPCIVLISSDGDYSYAMNKLRVRGVLIVVLFRRQVHKHLTGSANEAIELDGVLQGRVSDQDGLGADEKVENRPS